MNHARLLRGGFSTANRMSSCYHASLRRGRTVCIAAAVALFWGCGFPDGTLDTNALVPDVCDGSTAVRLYVADWAAGSSNSIVDYVMYADGVRFLKVDGNCHYYVFDGQARDYLWWGPVREGDLSEAQLGDILERLQVGIWSTFDEQDLVFDGAVHPGWNRFHLAGAEYECPSGCAPDSTPAMIAFEAQALITELAAQSVPVVATTLEVAVVEEQAPAAAADLPLKVEWGAAAPLEAFVEVVRAGNDDSDEIGTILPAAEQPWFGEIREEYLSVVPAGLPSEIGIVDESGTVTHDLYVRQVVP